MGLENHTEPHTRRLMTSGRGELTQAGFVSITFGPVTPPGGSYHKEIILIRENNLYARGY